jgi:hypothetical protein
MQSIRWANTPSKSLLTLRRHHNYFDFCL